MSLLPRFKSASPPSTEVPCVPPTVVIEPPPPGPYFAPITLQAIASGTPPFTYQWFAFGAPIGGATDPELSIAEGAGTIDYSVEVTNACGTVTSETVQVQDPVP